MKRLHTRFFFDGQPRRLLARVALHAHRHPAAHQLSPSQLELQIAVTRTLVRISDRHPSAGVPDDDIARTVVLGEDRALEARTPHRIILDWDRPAFERAGHFGPEVAVQAARPVFLDHKGELIDCALGIACRFGRLQGISLGPVGPQRIGHRVRRRRRRRRPGSNFLYRAVEH